MSDLKTALKELLDGIHAGRFKITGSGSVGYCTSLIDNAEQALAAAEEKPAEGYTLNGNKTVAVSNDTYLSKDMAACPRGCKVQLLGAGGVLSYALYDGDPFWKEWAPLPRRAP